MWDEATFDFGEMGALLGISCSSRKSAMRRGRAGWKTGRMPPLGPQEDADGRGGRAATAPGSIDACGALQANRLGEVEA